MDTCHYQNIIQIAREIAQLRSRPVTQDVASLVDVNSTLLHSELPVPVGIAPILADLGLPECVAVQLSGSYTRSALQLRMATMNSLRKALSQLPKSRYSVDSHVISSTFKIKYEQGLQTLRTQCVEQSKKALALQDKGDTGVKQTTPILETRGNIRKQRRPTFNNEYTPLLEKYFEYNAYPSAPDRAILARKSMMSPRQIEVWFQNHRNRAKKEGRVLKRLHINPLPLELSLDSLEDTMPLFAIPESERCIPHDIDIIEGALSDEKLSPDPSMSVPVTNVFSVPRPSHAFPTIFRPQKLYEAFPHDNGTFKFPPPVWGRKPTTVNSKRTPKAIDFDEFITAFVSKLHFREASPSRNRKDERVFSSSRSSQPWYTATVYIPSSAPHPALVQTQQIARILKPPLVISENPRTSPTSESSIFSCRSIARLPTGSKKAAAFAYQGPTNSSRCLTPKSRASSFSSSSSFDEQSDSSRSTSCYPTTPPLSPCATMPVFSGTDRHFRDESLLQLPSIFSTGCSDMADPFFNMLSFDLSRPPTNVALRCY